MSLTRHWTWEYNIHQLGSWPTRPPYTGQHEPCEILKAADVDMLLGRIRTLLTVIHQNNSVRGLQEEISALEAELERVRPKFYQG
jgi:hypothetical protein